MRSDVIFAKVGSVFGIRTDASTLDLSSVQETFRALKANYDGELDEEALIHGASRGMVAAVGDAHTVYLDPAGVKELEDSLSGNIGGGIGAGLEV